MIDQLSFDLPARPALGRSDFFVAPANEIAFATLETWPAWPGGKLLLTGPRGAGKSHLAQIWAERAGARTLAADDLPGQNIPELSTTPLVIEDAERVAGDRAGEEALLHLHNHALSEGRSLLLTARRAPSLWGMALPDLASRMEATPAVTIAGPDDQLLSVVLGKLFADRQIVPMGDVIPYLVRRIERSYGAAIEAVAAIDKRSLNEKREVSRPIAASVLDELEIPTD